MGNVGGRGGDGREQQRRDFYINLINYKLRDKNILQNFVHVELSKLTDLRTLRIVGVKQQKQGHERVSG